MSGVVRSMPAPKRLRTNAPVSAPSESVGRSVEVIDLVDSDREADTVEVVSNRADSSRMLGRRKFQDLSASNYTEDENDVDASGVWKNLVVYAHARSDCLAFKFKLAITDEAHGLNMLNCEKCYCYVCDKPVLECPDWQRHCMAYHKLSSWRSLRAGVRAKPGITVSVPDEVLPPKLRSGKSPSRPLKSGRSSASRKITPRAATGNGTRNLGALWKPFMVQSVSSRSPESGGPCLERTSASVSHSSLLASKSSLPTDATTLGAASACSATGMRLQNSRDEPSDLSVDFQQSAVASASDSSYSLPSQPKLSLFSDPGLVGGSFNPRRHPLRTSEKYTLIHMSAASTRVDKARAPQLSAEIARFKEPETRFLLGKIDLWRPFCSHFDVSAAPNCTLSGCDNAFRVSEHPNDAVIPRILAVEMGVGTFSKHINFDLAYPVTHLDSSRADLVHLRRKASRFGDCFLHSCTSEKQVFAGYFFAALDNAIKNELLSVRWELQHYPGSEKLNPSNAMSMYHPLLTVDDLGTEEFVRVISETISWRNACSARLQTLEKLTTANCCRLRAWVYLTKKSFSSNNVKVAANFAPGGSPYSYMVPVDFQSSPCVAPATALGVKPMRPAFSGFLGKVLSRVDFVDFSSSESTLASPKFIPASNMYGTMPVCRGVFDLDQVILNGFEAKCSSSSALIQPRDRQISHHKLFSVEGILMSPLFTVSEGYPGGQALQPEFLSVSLRPYQLETLQWMQDQEARVSISEPFWKKLACLPIHQNQTAAMPLPIWLCPLTGHISSVPPPPIQGGILAEEMGLGKTVEVIALIVNSLTEARQYANFGLTNQLTPTPVKTTLIVTPVSLLKQWEMELQRRTTPACNLKVGLWYGQSRPLDIQTIGTYDVMLTTYSTLSSRVTNGVLQRLLFFRIVIDESTYIKGGPSSALYNCLITVPSQRRWAVSGTPFGDNMGVLETVLRYLGVSPWCSSAMFRVLVSAFNETIRSGKVHRVLSDVSASFPVHALAYILKSIVMRHVKNQFLNGRPLIELPPASGRVVWITLNPEEREKYDDLETQAREEVHQYLNNEDVAKNSIIALQSKLIPLRMAAGGVVRVVTGQVAHGKGTMRHTYSTVLCSISSKLSRLLQDMSQYTARDPSSKFVIFTEFDIMRQSVGQVLAANGFGVLSIDGSLSATVRGNILKSFEVDPDKVALVLSNKSAHGLSLTCANVVVLLEPSLSREVELQACDRVHRIGQLRDVEVLTYITRNTVDERILVVRRLRGLSPAIGEAVPGTGCLSLPHVVIYKQYYGIA